MSFGEKHLKAAAHSMVENLDGSDQLIHLMHLAQLVKTLKPTEVSWLVAMATKLRRDHDTEDTALSLTDPQGVVDSMTRKALPLTDTDAVVLMVHAVCVMEGLKVEAAHNPSEGVEGGCYWLPLVNSSEGRVYPIQRYTTPQGATVVLEPTTEDRGLIVRLRCHATPEVPQPSTAPDTPTHTHTCVSSVLSLDTCKWVRSRFFWKEQVNVTCNMTGDVARLRRVLVDSFLAQLPRPNETDAQTRVDRLSMLPTHVLHRLLAYLPAAEVAYSARTCKATHAAVQDSAMWAILLDRDDPAWRRRLARMEPEARAEEESMPLYERYGAWARRWGGWHQTSNVPPGIFDPRGKTQKIMRDVDKDYGSYDHFRHGVKIPKPRRAHHVYRYSEREVHVLDWSDNTPLVNVYVGPYGW